MTSAAIVGPHKAIPVTSGRERFCVELFDVLWDRYRQRVSYVRTYEQVIRAAGATFVNDHIAFRTFAAQQPLAGIAMISRVFEALGYRAAGNYTFDDKQLSAIHFQHANQQFPKLFISELRVWELPPAARGTIDRAVRSHRPAIGGDVLAALAQLDQDAAPAAELLPQVVAQFHELPWILPAREDVQALNKVSQYAAGAGARVQRTFHVTDQLARRARAADAEKTIALRRGRAMKAETKGSAAALRQMAISGDDVAVHDRGVPAKLPDLRYFELAHATRWPIRLPGKQARFEGFGLQATNLFEMTDRQRSLPVVERFFQHLGVGLPGDVVGGLGGGLRCRGSA
jgi:hypothetical protein